METFADYIERCRGFRNSARGRGLGCLGTYDDTAVRAVYTYGKQDCGNNGIFGNQRLNGEGYE